MEVSDPAVAAEVRAAFEAYERALVANDVDALDEWFWNDERVVRFAFGVEQHGWQEVSDVRRALLRQTPPRTIRSLDVVTYGDDVAAVFAVFVVDDSGELVHQSQVWAKLDGAWRVTAAHVSTPPGSGK
jgi:hypothetical protein